MELKPNEADFARFRQENPEGFWHFKAIIMERVLIGAARQIDEMKADHSTEDSVPES